MISGETMQYRKVRRFLRHHVPNKIFISRKICSLCAAFILCVQDEKKLLSSFPPLYQTKLQGSGFQDVVSINKIKFEP